MEKTYHFTPRENGSGIDSIVKVSTTNNGTDIIWICKDESGNYSFGYFDSWCNEKIASDRYAFLRFFCENDCAGWSESEYETKEQAFSAMINCNLPLSFTNTELLLIQ